MSDARLRTLERISGSSPEARARLLGERLRAGWGGMEVPCPNSEHAPCGGRATDKMILARHAKCEGTGRLWLPRGRLELAAYCGDEAALRAYACRHDDLRDGARGCICYYGTSLVRGYMAFARWLSGLSRWGPEVLLRAAVAAGRVAWREVASPGGPHAIPSGDVLAALAAIQAAEAWLACPCEAYRRVWWERQLDVAERGVGTYVPNPEDPAHVTLQRVERAASLAGEPAVRSGIQAALVMWALGPDSTTREEPK